MALLICGIKKIKQRIKLPYHKTKSCHRAAFFIRLIYLEYPYQFLVEFLYYFRTAGYLTWFNQQLYKLLPLFPTGFYC